MFKLIFGLISSACLVSLGFCICYFGWYEAIFAWFASLIPSLTSYLG